LQVNGKIKILKWESRALTIYSEGIARYTIKLMQIPLIVKCFKESRKYPLMFPFPILKWISGQEIKSPFVYYIPINKT